MAVAKIEAAFDCDLETVWNIVTSLKQSAWRSDLSKIEVFEAGKKFVEYTKDGYATTFVITTFEPYRRYEFDMENENMKGHWTGLFTEKDGKTTLVFTEDVTAKKMRMKPFVGAYLKKQQAVYLTDLKKALETAGV